MKLHYRDTPLAVNWHICYWLVISNLGQSQKSDRNRGSWLVESSECCLLIGREVHQKIFKGITLMIQKLCQWNIFELKWRWIGSSQDLKLYYSHMVWLIEYHSTATVLPLDCHWNVTGMSINLKLTLTNRVPLNCHYTATGLSLECQWDVI